MKVLLINSFDKGGAANSCKRLHLGLLSKNIDSKILIKFKQKNWINSFRFHEPPKKLSTKEKVEYKTKRILKEFKLYTPKNNSDNKEQVFLKSRHKGLEMFSFPDSGSDITQSNLYKEADVINLHWVANFLDYKSFFEKNTKPVVWTLHDMNPFSGGEHYEENFLGIDKAGFPIRRERSKEELMVAKKNIAIKKQLLSKVDNLTIVAPSEWLAQEARKSEVFKGKSIHCIPYGLDPKIYSSRDQAYSRDLLNIPGDKKVILFVADSISNNRKGFAYLKRAIQQLKNQDVVLCAIGQKDSESESIDNILELGPIYDERLLSAAYSAADVFVIPSLMDNLPNTVLESLMCGTPVIGFPIGGIPEMIQDEINGLVAKGISVNALVESLNIFLNTLDNFDRNSIRSKAITKYDLKIQANSYNDLFERILEL